MNPVLIGRILGVVAGLLLQWLVFAPAIGSGPLTIVSFVVLFVGGLIAGDRIASWAAREARETSVAEVMTTLFAFPLDLRWRKPSRPAAPTGLLCGRCGKPLSPYWREKCRHCGATFVESPPVTAAGASGLVRAPMPYAQAVTPSPASNASSRRPLVIGGVLVVALAVGAAAYWLSDAGQPAVPDVSHDASELEALLPVTVNGETLVGSSIVGHTFIERIGETVGLDAEAYERGYVDGGDDLARLRMASASPNGGLDFVRVVSFQDDEAGARAFELMVWSAGIRVEHFYADAYQIQDDEIAGKPVGIGPSEMMVHESPGLRPYFYGTDGYQFVIVTDDPAWAEAVIDQLP